LKTLDLSFTNVSDLTPLSAMKELTIDVEKGQQVKVPKEFEGRVKRD